MTAKQLLTSLAAALPLVAAATAATAAAATPPAIADRPVAAPDGDVRVAAQRGATAYLAGAFASLSPNVGGAAVLDADTGRLRHGLPGDAGFEARAAVPDGDGGWYVGGITGLRAPLVRLRADGTVDPAFAPPLRPRDDVHALELDGDRLIVGGDFPAPRPDLVALDAATGAALPAFGAGLPPNTWVDQGRISDARDRVAALALSGGALWVARARSHDDPGAVLRLNPTTGAATAEPVVTPGPAVRLAADAGRVYAAVEPDTGGPQVWALDAATTGPAGTPGFPREIGSGPVLTLTAAAGVVYVGRYGRPSTGSGLLALDGATGAPLAGFAGSTLREVGAVAVRGGRLYAAGRDTLSPTWAPEIVELHPRTGAERDAFDGRVDEVPMVLALDVAGRLLAGGSISSAGGRRIAGLAAVDIRTGRPLAGFAGPRRPLSAGRVRPCAIAVTSASIAVALSPRHLDAASPCRGGTLRLFDRATGRPVRSFDPPPLPRLRWIDAAGDRVIVAAGTVRGGRERRTRIVALDRDGRVAGIDRELRGIVNAIDSRGPTVYVAGRFSARPGQARTGLAAFDAASGRRPADFQRWPLGLVEREGGFGGISAPGLIGVTAHRRGLLVTDDGWVARRASARTGEPRGRDGFAVTALPLVVEAGRVLSLDGGLDGIGLRAWRLPGLRKLPVTGYNPGVGEPFGADPYPILMAHRDDLLIAGAFDAPYGARRRAAFLAGYRFTGETP